MHLTPRLSGKGVARDCPGHVCTLFRQHVETARMARPSSAARDTKFPGIHARAPAVVRRSHGYGVRREPAVAGVRRQRHVAVGLRPTRGRKVDRYFARAARCTLVAGLRDRAAIKPPRIVVLGACGRASRKAPGDWRSPPPRDACVRSRAPTIATSEVAARGRIRVLAGASAKRREQLLET